MSANRYTGRGKRRGSLTAAGVAAIIAVWFAALSAFLGWLL